MVKIPGLWRIEPFVNRIKELTTYTYEKLIYKPWNFPGKNRFPDTIFIGASITKQWMIDIRFPFIRIKDIYKFDKSEAIDEIIESKKKPDIIFLKECASYFPGDLNNYKKLIERWAEQISSKDIKLILVTVIPVTESHSKNFPKRIEEIWEFNNWIREFTSINKIALLDFETALSISKEKKYLKQEYAQRDGLHLNRTAYRKVLDPLLGTFLSSII